jgi:hypothetical protein
MHQKKQREKKTLCDAFRFASDNKARNPEQTDYYVLTPE